MDATIVWGIVLNLVHTPYFVALHPSSFTFPLNSFMEATVKGELGQFLNQKISAESLSSVDDIVLGYIVSVLEQLGEDEEFDVDEFAEIMAAYIPGFDAVNRDDVYTWMLDLTEKLVKTRTSGNQNKEGPDLTTEDDFNSSSSSLKADVLLSDRAVKESQTRNPSGQSFLHGQAINDGVVEDSQVPISSDSKCHNQETGVEQNMEKESSGNGSFSEEVSVLAEMFPESCSLEIRNCLMVANGDVESAVQLMLLKGENTDDESKENCPRVLDFSPKAHRPSSKRQELQEAEQQNLKEQMMARYGYVEVDQEDKAHQPTLHKQEEKRLVRYRNNQVVSTKGERFSYVKQEESEEMKKTYVNIKPARKYRFH
ncbi:CUE domain-containing protein 2-like isoform X1 [Oculina patagonica]